MEIILLENILNLGKIGDKVVVANGYGRNFLLRKGKALRFNKKNQEFVDKKIFTIIKESKENGELYGSVKPKEIANIIQKQSKAQISPSQITLKENLNKIGLYYAEINLHSEVKAKISIKIDKIKSK